MDLPSDGDALDRLAEIVAERVLQGLHPTGIGGRVPALEEPQLPSFPSREGIVDAPRPATLHVAGVELTQSIQHHGAAGPSYGTDNSVPLVALKSLVARALPVVSPGILSDNLTGARVSGELTLSVGNRVVYRTGPTRPTGARVGPRSSLDRSLWDEELTFSVPSKLGSGVAANLMLETLNPPLNFIVPGYYCRKGGAVVSVTVWPLLGDGSRGKGATWWQRVEFLDVPAPRVCFVRVNWTDSAGVTSTPSDADMLGTVSTAERMLPFPYFETTILATDENSTAAFATGATTPGSCNVAWDKLVAGLAVTSIFTALFGLGDIVVGFVPSAAIPAGAGSIVVGCGRGGMALFVGQQTTFAHELGHIFGRNHVAVPGDPFNDTAYPNYGGSRRSIGEVGIDTGSVPPTLYDPATNIDIMGYTRGTEGQWISPYTYRAILDARGLHQSAPADPRHVRPRLVLSVRLTRARKVLVRKAIRVDAAGVVPRPWDDATSPLSIDVLDADGQILLVHHMLYSPPRGCGCCGATSATSGREPWLDMDEVIDWPEGAASIAFHTGDEPLLTITAGEPPRLEVSDPTRDAGRLRFQVTADHPRETPAVAVLFTGDGGDTWWPIAFDPVDGVVDVEESRLPARGRCRFRVLATAELQSASLDTDEFELAATPRRMHILAPNDDCPIDAGPVSLKAMIDLHGHTMPGTADVRWRSSIEGDLGSGLVIAPDLSTGTHEITVSAPDGIGGTLEERAIIVVGG